MVLADMKVTVLYVDQAAAFGGSLVVMGCLVRAIDNNHFRSVVIGETDLSILNHYMDDSTRIYIIPRFYNYVSWEKTKKLINKVKIKSLRKAINYMFSVLRSLANSIYFMRLASVIINEKVNIIHINNGMNNLAPVIAAILLRRKFIVHFHGMETPGFIQRVLIKKTPKFIAVSEYIKNGLIKRGFPADKIIVVPNPVLTKPVSSDLIDNSLKKYFLSVNDRIFGIVGRIVRWKGHVEFLEAAKVVLESVPNSKAMIIGNATDGDTLYQERIFKIAKSSTLKDRIIFTGYVEDVEVYYNILDVCVHTSIEPEPFGLVITEAMSHGVPVVASDRGAPKEIISNGVNGFLVDPVDTVNLSEAIIKLLGDPDLRSKIGGKGKEHVLKDYNLDAYGREIERIYMKVLERAI